MPACFMIIIHRLKSDTFGHFNLPDRQKFSKKTCFDLKIC